MNTHKNYRVSAGQAETPCNAVKNDYWSILTSYPEILTLEQTCEALQIGLTTGRALCREKQLPGIKIGGLWRIPRAHLEAYLNKDEQARQR